LSAPTNYTNILLQQPPQSNLRETSGPARMPPSTRPGGAGQDDYSFEVAAALAAAERGGVPPHSSFQSAFAGTGPSPIPQGWQPVIVSAPEEIAPASAAAAAPSAGGGSGGAASAGVSGGSGGATTTGRKLRKQGQIWLEQITQGTAARSVAPPSLVPTSPAGPPPPEPPALAPAPEPAASAPTPAPAEPPAAATTNPNATAEAAAEPPSPAPGSVLPPRPTGNPVRPGDLPQDVAVSAAVLSGGNGTEGAGPEPVAPPVRDASELLVVDSPEV